MNKVQILAKIKRDMDMLKIVATLDPVAGSVVTSDGAIISCVDASIQAPMGGINGNVSPFLGIGVAAPGQLKMKGASGENTVSAVLASALRAQVFMLLCGFANDIVIEAGDTATQLAYVQGSVDLHMMGS